MRIKTDDIHPVVVHARKNGPYFVPNTLLMPGDVSLYIMNDSHIQFKDIMVVAIGQEASHIEKVSASDGLLTKWNGQSVLNQSNGSFHLDGIIGVEGEDVYIVNWEQWNHIEGEEGRGHPIIEIKIGTTG